MEADKLRKGLDYQIQKKDNLPHEKCYVMNQFLPSTGKEWATFFSVVGSKRNWRLFRTRIPLKNISKVEDKVITTSKKSVTTVIWPDEEKNHLMQEWLNEVKSILERKVYRKSQSFVEYFGKY